jgi:hypothetical protein
MKDCKLIIKINKSASDVFRFTLDPKNTPLWVESIVQEEVNETPTQVGTIYKNVNKEGVWSEYLVTQYEKDRLFEFVASDKNYHVKYTITPLTDSSCELEYFEWVESGELEVPFTMEVLEKLKLALEK